jgi:hypothetical protein
MAHSSPPLSSQECFELARILDIRLGAHIGHRRFDIQCSEDAYAQGVDLRITLASPDKTYVHEVLARFDAQNESPSKQDACLMMLDYAEGFFEEHLREGAVYLPLDWSSCEWSGITFLMKGSISNKHLESLADEILACAPSKPKEEHSSESI